MITNYHTGKTLFEMITNTLSIRSKRDWRMVAYREALCYNGWSQRNIFTIIREGFDGPCFNKTCKLFFALHNE